MKNKKIIIQKDKNCKSREAGTRVILNKKKQQIVKEEQKKYQQRDREVENKVKGFSAAFI